MEELKRTTIRGGAVRILAQGVNFALRLGTLMILARLLEPQDFGLVGMVTVFTGVLALFRDLGLSSATVQRAEVTDDQISTLFWVNVLVGSVLGGVALAAAPALATLYREPQLVGITVGLALAFVFNSLGMQHGSLLQREMRFAALAVINIVSLVVGGAVAIIGAKLGFGYWALVAMTVVISLSTSAGTWITSGWVPGRPRRRTGIGSMVRFGGLLTTNSFIYYAATNFDKVLVGRYWGSEVLGIYGRAYQLANIPVENLNSAAGEVAFSALSRVQNDLPRHKGYFLKGYGIIVAITVPITVGAALFARDVILVALGPKWIDAVSIFRLFAPTILAFALVNPLGWFIYSLGMAQRGVKMAVALALIIMLACALAVPFGAWGEACAYSVVMLGWTVPAIVWATKGTVLTSRDVFRSASRPLLAGLVAGVVAYGGGLVVEHLVPLGRLVIESSVLFSVYAVTLYFVSEERDLYAEILRQLCGLKKADEPA